MKKKTIRKLKIFVESYFPQRAGDKSFLQLVKRNYKAKLAE